MMAWIEGLGFVAVALLAFALGCRAMRSDPENLGPAPRPGPLGVEGPRRRS